MQTIFRLGVLPLPVPTGLNSELARILNAQHLVSAAASALVGAAENAEAYARHLTEFASLLSNDAEAAANVNRSQATAVAIRHAANTAVTAAHVEAEVVAAAAQAEANAIAAFAAAAASAEAARQQRIQEHVARRMAAAANRPAPTYNLRPHGGRNNKDSKAPTPVSQRCPKDVAIAAGLRTPPRSPLANRRPTRSSKDQAESSTSGNRRHQG